MLTALVIGWAVRKVRNKLKDLEPPIETDHE